MVEGPSSAAVLTPRVVFADQPEGFTAPQIPVAGDAGGAHFTEAITLSVPNLLSLLNYPSGDGAFTDLGLDVKSRFFATHHDWECEVTVQVDGKPFDKRLFHSWYGRNQFLIPIPTFRREAHEVLISARPTCVGAVAPQDALFELDVYLTSKPRVYAEFEKSAIWVFSTARSGSTWLVMDLICADVRARPMDESGVGRMFAPLQWDAERFFDPAARPFHIESGLDFETGAKNRENGALPIFERFFSQLAKENQILSRHNFDFYHRALRDIALSHALNEWGMFGFPRFVFKMPNDSHAADFIMRAFPDSYMVFLVRDGRDVLRSRFSPFASSTLASTKNSELRRYAVAYYSHLWNFQVDIIRSAFDVHPEDRRMCLRYEDMRADPVTSIIELYATLGMQITREGAIELALKTRLENMPESERGPDKPRQEGLVGGYKRTFTAEEIALMNAIMGPNLTRFGYQL